MCFSASASFGAGAVLTVISVASIKKTNTTPHLLFASIPFVFGVQQITEGILWLSLPNSGFVYTQKIFTHIFLFFAQIVWPLWVPIAILRLEKKNTRTFIQKALVGAGAIAGLYLAYCLINYHVEAKIIGHHIIYIQNYPVSFRNICIVWISNHFAAIFFAYQKDVDIRSHHFNLLYRYSNILQPLYFICLVLFFFYY